LYLLDTTHCSRIIQGDTGTIRRLSQLDEILVATCVIVRGELQYMAHKSQQRDSNLELVERFLQDIEVYPVDEEAADIYGRIKAALIHRFGPKERAKRRKAEIRKLGVSENDLWIAAVAARYQLTLISADKDFDRIKQVEDLSVESW